MKKTGFLSILFFIILFVSFSNSAEAATEVRDNIATPTIWNKSGSPYIVLNTIYITAPLTIEPGVVVKFRNNSTTLVVQGTLNVVGESSEKIILTSVCDGNYGGDTAIYASPYCHQTPSHGQWGGISIYNTSNTVKIKNAKILYAGRGLSYQMYNYDVAYQGLVSIENTEIRYSNSGIYIRNAIPSMRSLILSENKIGLEVTTSLLDRIPKISNSSIFNNETGIRALLSGIRGSMPVDASYNWWGDTSGPYFYHSDSQKANLPGQGNKIIGDGVIFRPWLESEPIFDNIPCIDDCYSNVLFLPGLEASRLYRADGSGEDQLWEPNTDSDVKDLFLDERGKSIRDDIYTRDVIDNAYLPIKGNIYRSFLSDLERWKNADGLIFDYGVTPYDWRLSLDDILNSGKKTGENISYTESTASPYIIQELRRLAGTSKSGKVTLIAHSNGGLVTKALTKKLGTEAAELIDKIVFVAVPQSGTPQTIGAILHGYAQGLPVNWLPFALKPKTARMLAQNMSSAYNLLPSDAYFSGKGGGVTTPVIVFEDGASTDSFIGKYGKEIDTSTELHDFLLDNDGKVAFDSSDTVSPSNVNPELLAYGENTHQELDNWSVPVGVSVYQIAGFGEETLGTIKYWTGQECLHEGGKICSSRVPKLEYTPELVVDGDGTVVTPSALAMSTSAANVSRWWVDLGGYNKQNVDRKHASIFEVSGLRNFIKDNVLIQENLSYPDYVSASKPSIDDTRRLRYYLHSPLTLSARDSAGNGISASVSTIPDARYKRFGEVQYISLPAASNPTVVLDGFAEGSFTLEVQEVEGNTVIAATTFVGIPSSVDTKVSMDFSDGTIANASPLTVDYDGNGAVDFSLDPSLGEMVLFDISPPITTSLVTGTRGSNDWHMSDVIVTLAAQDEGNGSGVAKTEYSLDNGTTWRAYVDSFGVSHDGINTILYFSTDKQGNEENPKTIIVKIDKTAPEISFSFDPLIKKMAMIGDDNLSAVTTDVFATSITITDEAGHKTTATFAKNEVGKQIKFEMRSLAYDDVAVSLLPIALNYEWSLEKTEDVKMLNELAMVGDVQIRAHYLAKDNATTITKMENSVTMSATRSGLSILRIVTDQRKVIIKY